MPMCCLMPGRKTTGLIAITSFEAVFRLLGVIPSSHSLAEALSKAEEPYAATALPAAWLWTRYGSFNLCTLYISRPPSPGLRKDLGFQEEADGANTWAGGAQ